MASSYSEPNAELLALSYQTYWTARRTGTLRVFDVFSINSVVMMAPDPHYPDPGGVGPEMWYRMEKPGLEVSTMLGDTPYNDNDGL